MILIQGMEKEIKHVLDSVQFSFQISLHKSKPAPCLLDVGHRSKIFYLLVHTLCQKLLTDDIKIEPGKWLFRTFFLTFQLIPMSRCYEWGVNVNFVDNTSPQFIPLMRFSFPSLTGIIELSSSVQTKEKI